MGKTAVAIDLTDSERRELQSLASRRRTAQGLAQRARIVLLAAEGVENKNICERVGAAPNTVGKWRRRFAERRMEGLLDEPRPGAPRQIGDDEVAEIVRLTLEATPRDATHWSLRSLANAVGLAPSTIHRIWKAFSLQPHRAETFKLSTDPLFVEKVRDIVGLYLSPPERAIVLCVDEKSQIQDCPCVQAKSSGAPMTTRPWNPQPGRGARRRHRQGPRQMLRPPSGREFRAFLNVIDKPICRGAHRSTEELEAAIANYIDAVNAKLKPFVWTKSADDILASVKRFCASILSASQTSIATTSESGQ